jgi:hypothetical protein
VCSISVKRIGCEAQDFVGHPELRNLETLRGREELSYIPKSRQGPRIIQTAGIGEGGFLSVNFNRPSHCLVHRGFPIQPTNYGTNMDAKIFSHGTEFAIIPIRDVIRKPRSDGPNINFTRDGGN